MQSYCHCSDSLSYGPLMKRVLITGMSGTGKSSVISALAALGHTAVDTDYGGWCVPPDGSEPPDEAARPGWVWDPKRMAALLASELESMLFVGGCVENQGDFYESFDEIVLLTASPAVVEERLTARSTNTYGKDPGELAQALEDQRMLEPMLKRRATMVIDTEAPIEQVMDAILARVST